jgi:hypothetical protein
MSRSGRVYITLADLAAALGWERRKALRWAKKEKVVFMVAGRWVTTKDRLVTSFPEVWDCMRSEE